MRSQVAGSVTSPATATVCASRDASIARELATTAQPRRRYAATTPAPIPREAPVTITTLVASGVLAAGSSVIGFLSQPGARRRSTCQGPLHVKDHRGAGPGA